GTRQFIKVLRLLEDHPMSRLKRAVDRALWSGVNSPDAIAQFLTPAAAWLPTFSLDGREHLCGVKVAGPDISAYGSLLCFTVISHISPCQPETTPSSPQAWQNQ
ncbi:hypothetical protein ACFL0Q_01800, partial [Thermodesulfobacteriota bacterium]